MMEPKKAHKITSEEAKTLDRAKRGQTLVSKPQEGEVQGQYMIIDPLQCPWCGTYVWILDDPKYHWYICRLCGNDFRC